MAVGRDTSKIERTLGFKPTIRTTAEAAQRTWLDILAANRTRTSRMEGDVSVWVGTPEQIAETMLSYRKVGFHTFIAELPAPYDEETMDALINVVKPMVEGAPVPS